MPKQILTAVPAGTARPEVPATLGTKPTLLIWGMKDRIQLLENDYPQTERDISDHVLVELPNAKHFIQRTPFDRIAARDH